MNDADAEISTAAPPPLPTGLPDDWTFPHDLPCPTCRYNLRMLRTPRCPECGGAFRWQTLLRIRCPRCGESLEAHDGEACPKCRLALDWSRLVGDAKPQELKLYEYSGKPLRAALRAWRDALRPASFWRSIPIELPPVIGKLRSLRNAALAIGMLGVAALLFVDKWVFSAILKPSLALTFVCFTVPVTTMLLLPAFQPTLMRFRVRREQLLRVVAYGCTSCFWSGVLLLLAAGILLLARRFWFAMMWIQRVWNTCVDYFFAAPMPTPPANIPWAGAFGASLDLRVSSALPWLALAFGVAWPMRFFTIALGRYLQLDPPNVRALMLSSQVIAILLLVILLCNFAGLEWELGRLIAWLTY